MKTNGVVCILIVLMAGWINAIAQTDRVSVPGDHFSLEGALELFKKSSSPEEFERMLNSPDSQVNNLDLNGDGDIDYIKVIDRYQGNVHAFILQAVISPNEYQDVAVIELEKTGNGKAVLQIIGDEDIYGIETIIEPTDEVRVMAGTSTNRVYVNVWTWPVVQYVYDPYYYAWVSPYYWTYRPVWWRPWRPVTYFSYYSRWEPYRTYYSVCHTHRIAYAQPVYRPYRTTSVIVYNRHHTQISSYRSAYPTVPLYRGRDDNRTFRTSEGRDYEGNRSVNSSRSSKDRWRSPETYDRHPSINSGKPANPGNRTYDNRATEWTQPSDRSNWRTDREHKQFSGTNNPNRNDRQGTGAESRSRTDRTSSVPGIYRNDQQQNFERRQGFERNDSKPVYDVRSVQQRSSAVHRENRSAPGNHGQRSGSNHSNSKSLENRRGRE